VNCGPGLFECRCGGYRTPLRTQAEVDALHHEAVRRAHASGFAAAPVPAWVVAVLWPYAWRDEVAA
jgi:hypothetical protein